MPDGSFYYGVRLGRDVVYVTEFDTASVDLQYVPRPVAPTFHSSGVDWSPDGERLAYVAPAGGVSPTTWTIAIRSLKTGAVQKLPQDVDILHRLHPRWSPDGSSLLGHGWDPKAPPRELVYRIDVDTGSRTIITSTSSLWGHLIDWVGWYDDGRAVTYLTPQSGFLGTARVMRFDPMLGEETELLAHTVPPYLYAYNASPDGGCLALGLYSPQGDSSTVKIVSTADDSLELPGIWDTPVWFPDSRRFL